MKTFKRLLIIPPILIITLSIFYWDRSIALFMKEFTPSALKYTCRFLSLWIAPLFHLILWPLIWISRLVLKKKDHLKNLNACLHIFAMNGWVTLFKVGIGRPRPKLFYSHNLYQLQMFSFDSHYHSFPSRHSATIFLVALFLPKKRYRLYYCLVAFLLSLSRIPTNAHYLSDVLAGGFVAFFSYTIAEWLQLNLKGYYENKSQI